MVSPSGWDMNCGIKGVITAVYKSSITADYLPRSHLQCCISSNQIHKMGKWGKHNKMGKCGLLIFTIMHYYQQVIKQSGLRIYFWGLLSMMPNSHNHNTWSVDRIEKHSDMVDFKMLMPWHYSEKLGCVKFNSNLHSTALLECIFNFCSECGNENFFHFHFLIISAGWRFDHNLSL